MRDWAADSRRIAWLLPALALAAFAYFDFCDGLARDAAIPVPTYMIAQVAMPRAAYQDAVAALASADPHDGDATIARGEASLRSGMRPLDVAPVLIDGLEHAPASSRGWLLLSEVWRMHDRRKAVQALRQAYLAAPNDYWLAGARTRDAAALWPQLDAGMRQRALLQAHDLWEEPSLRDQIRPVLFSQDGVALMARAFAGRPRELRAMNRWLAMQRLVDPLSAPAP